MALPTQILPQKPTSSTTRSVLYSTQTKHPITSRTWATATSRTCQTNMSQPMEWKSCSGDFRYTRPLDRMAFQPDCWRSWRQNSLQSSPSYTTPPYSQDTIPAEWKQADVVPIYKKGAKNRPENYRPVSLTAITCKMLEHVITSSM